MPKRAKELSALAVKNLTTPGLHFVGGGRVPGLALQVLPTGGRSWVLRIMIGGKRRDMGLGGYPEVTLAEARDAAEAARKQVRANVDPIKIRAAEKAAIRAHAGKTMAFQDAALAFIQANEGSWRNDKHRQQWRNSLETYAYPIIGKMSLGDIELPHILKILEPIWESKTETATRLRGRIEQVLDWGTVRGFRDGLNPARWRGHLDKLLAKPKKLAKVKHHAALPWADIGAFMPKLRKAEGMGARALEFAILTACRSGEVRGATWAEIDLDAAIWTIPAERMKAGKPHSVPLSDAVVAMLKALPRMAGTNYVFPAPRGGQLSDMTLTAVLRRMDLNVVPHGFRSTFREWAGESSGHPREVIEHALAHQLADKAEAAYQRGSLFPKRVKLMQDWASFCAKPHSGNVVSLNSALAS
ncbi:tyrosine-type recombinase/integrase [Allosphingosinicella vermicomposti]|uniref:tyrosine-type recombinase/integrase n=1 Tax=Allosphingosinicella vermicomposti TaxID=614671 RepID=UPI000D10C418|nr:site-specific integrase [Allosphingosinicella vermicomposti]